jgi:PAS domain-containing protein
MGAIVDDLPDMVFVKEAENLRFVHINRAGEQLLGYDRADLIGKNDYDFFPADQAEFFTAKDRNVLAGRQVVDLPAESIDTARYQFTATRARSHLPRFNRPQVHLSEPARRMGEPLRFLTTFRVQTTAPYPRAHYSTIPLPNQPLY